MTTPYNVTIRGTEIARIDAGPRQLIVAFAPSAPGMGPRIHAYYAYVTEAGEPRTRFAASLSGFALGQLRLALETAAAAMVAGDQRGAA